MKQKQKIMMILLAVSMVFSHVFPCLAAENKKETEPLKEQEVTQIDAEELDLGDYQSAMEIGEKQLLVVTVLPMDTTNQKVTYSSSDESVATVNGMGRITAVQSGTSTITVTCQKISEKFELTVTEKSTESTEQTIAVSDIEIAAYEEELEVNKTMNLTATVLPANATDTQVIYHSDNPMVAAVSSTGEVKGIAPGSVTITAMAGGITRAVPLTVKIATAAIKLNKNCVIVKCGESLQVTASVEPAGAAQALTYKSKNSSIAAITADGIITGQAVGNTTVIVSNGDMSNSVTVIVNEGNVTVESQDPENKTPKAKGESGDIEDDSLIQRLSKQQQVTVDAADYPLLTRDILKKLYQTKATLEINAPEYSIKISGKDIENFENELHTKIELKKEKEGISFVVNEEKNLPGKIELKINQKETMKYVFLYNSSKNKYEQLAIHKANQIVIDTAGKYLFTQQKIDTLSMKLVIILGASGSILVIAAAYMIAKKRYWFW